LAKLNTHGIFGVSAATLLNAAKPDSIAADQSPPPIGVRPQLPGFHWRMGWIAVLPGELADEFQQAMF
jgi:hypothetical protein